MKVINKKILDLVHDIQDLATKIDDICVYYQSNVQVFNVYNNKKGIEKYSKTLYLDGYLTSEKKIINQLKLIIKDMEEMKNENRSKSDCFI